MTGIRWILAIGLAAFFVFMGVQKFGAENIIFATIAERSGISLFEPVIRIATGIGELLAAVLLVWPKFRRLGASLALTILFAAMAFHLSPLLGINVEGVGNSLFFMAMAATVITISILFVEMQAAKENKN
ncbi:MAG TPA: hypothetical protein ENK06_05200 [Gammaproteobacteria bacterium]|nr:hypothetical protein [Gammaproteobacteria bacterium]